MKSPKINGTSKKFSLIKSHLGVLEVRDNQKIWIRNFNSAFEKAVHDTSHESRFHSGSSKSEDSRALS